MPFNPLAVLLAVIASCALGALWYSPALFRRQWIRAARRKPRQNPLVYTLTILSATLSATVFALWLGPRPTLGSALLHGVCAGMAFSAASVGVNYAFAGRGIILWLIDDGFHVARFTLFGLVLGLLH